MMKKTIISIVAVAALFSGWTAHARVDLGDAGQDLCRVGENRDKQGRTNKGITLDLALQMVNTQQISKRKCQREIRLEFGKMEMTGPLVITVPAPKDRFYFGGRSVENPVVLDFSNIGPASKPLEQCVLTLENVRNITLKNLKIIGNNGASGICIGGADGKPVLGIELDNVHVEGAGGNGIIVKAHAKNTIIHATSSIDSTTEGDGVKIDTNRLDAANYIEATLLEPTGSDENGLAKFDEDPLTSAFKMVGVGSQRYVTAANGLMVRILRISQVGRSTVYRIEGDIVTRPETAESMNDLCGASRVNPSTGETEAVKRLQIYTINGNEGQFKTYVTGKERLDNATSFGVVTRGPQKGKFRFQWNTVNGAQLVLVPELVSKQVGNSSFLFGVDAATFCGGSAGGTGGSAFGDGLQLYSIKECRDARGLTGSGEPDATGLTEEYDSDGDGIPDILEDTNGNCICDSGDLSCWYKPDTDGDGILDGLELPFGEEGARCGEGLFHGENFENVCDVNGDGVSNAYSDDSDGDGLLDWQEDRRRVLNPYKASVITLPDGTEQSCSLGDYRSVGIKWDVYRVDDNNRAVVHVFENSQMGAEGPALYMLACQNKAVSSTDFNGQVDTGSGETSAYVVNIDDGSAPICAPNEDYYTIKDNPEDPRYLILNAERDVMGLKDADGNGVPDLYEVANWRDLSTLCEDFDNDSIPDCLERMNPGCDTEQLRLRSLNQRKAESDVDVFADSIDIDPIESLATNTITDSN
ncbi:MAG: hypothetical protein Q8P84_06980, partial [Deltaproteobacteria bacterium]|nr:hypothetical protein [Deltaproteobacteria bacterium]